MKLNPLFLSLFLFTVTPSSHAINVGDVTSIMGPDASTLAKEIINTTDTARYVSVSVERISSPMAGGTVIPMANRSELLSTPASLILPGNAKENFRFFYKGPQDNQERYYRISWTDEPVTEFEASKKKKQGEATTSANTGNASFRVISYGPCRDKAKDEGQGCRERYYVMPGVSVKIKHTDLTNKKTRIGIWHGEQYINVN
ncbi:hypothetical protein [Klebsiella pneumoniae]|uniref:EcpB family pilus assembly chaperone n=1 Tax=Klebsiella pneumoniae TaxID=573 RepID=UPI0025A2D156|nr:hypothetical protein [Klebsiella pneumoniae]MDM7368439.1 hypothetical protein [Klebsiella pneumoniae]